MSLFKIFDVAGSGMVAQSGSRVLTTCNQAPILGNS